jgi:ATP-dependent DNA helicase RecG
VPVATPAPTGIFMPVRFLKGIGDKLSEKFLKADITSLWDLLLLMPRKYLDHRKPMSFGELDMAARMETVVFARGRVESYHERRGGPRGRSLCEALVRIEQGVSALPAYVYFVWFHAQQKNFVEQKFPPGSELTFSGKAQAFRGRIQISHPDIYDQKRSEDEPWHHGAYVPIYTEISGISSRVLRKILYQALHRPEMETLRQTLPPEIEERFELPTLLASLRELHFPEHVEPHPEHGLWGSTYFKRLVFEELFYMSLSLLHQRVMWAMDKSLESQVPVLTSADAVMKESAKKLPFALTGDQAKVLEQIAADLACKKEILPMHRLVQGDVGSGKTVVAFLSMIAATEAGYQSALMAPTEILADQHYQNFVRMFPERAQRVILLKGSLTAKQKKLAREAIAAGEVDAVIGTQALIAEGTVFAKLGLVVVDEQHRFGVAQRIAMKKKNDTGIIPHLLVMTATPIPRSLALSLYGDLSLSVIREKPPGRQPIKTHLISDVQIDGLKRRIRDFVNEGKQIYLVYPLVEESEELDLRDVQSAFEEWTREFDGVSIGLLHGKMKAKDKEAAMASFKAGETRVLMATTVIEVGVDVPNASVMVIFHAERFGLSQLHQLRGRVGRGAEASLCVLVGPKNLGAQSKERLMAMVESDDGFFIAEKDLELRGPGEFLGTRQSGVPAFRVAQIIRDLSLMELARTAAEEVLREDPSLEKPESEVLRKGLKIWWGQRMELTQAG